MFIINIIRLLGLIAFVGGIFMTRFADRNKVQAYFKTHKVQAEVFLIFVLIGFVHIIFVIILR